MNKPKTKRSSNLNMHPSVTQCHRSQADLWIVYRAQWCIQVSLARRVSDTWQTLVCPRENGTLMKSRDAQANNRKPPKVSQLLSPSFANSKKRNTDWSWTGLKTSVSMTASHAHCVVLKKYYIVSADLIKMLRYARTRTAALQLSSITTALKAIDRRILFNRLSRLFIFVFCLPSDVLIFLCTFYFSYLPRGLLEPQDRDGKARRNGFKISKWWHDKQAKDWRPPKLKRGFEVVPLCASPELNKTHQE